MFCLGEVLLPEASVNFEDILVCFSEEEWESLDDCQRDLYDEVMKENCELLGSLELLLRRPTGKFSLKRQEEAYDGIAQKSLKHHIAPFTSSDYVPLEDIKNEQHDRKLDMELEPCSMHAGTEEEGVLLCTDRRPASNKRMVVERTGIQAAVISLGEQTPKPGAAWQAHAPCQYANSSTDNRLSKPCEDLRHEAPPVYSLYTYGSTTLRDDGLKRAHVAPEAGQLVEVSYNYGGTSQCDARQQEDLETRQPVSSLYKCEVASPSEDCLKQAHSEGETVQTVRAQYNCEVSSPSDDRLQGVPVMLDSVQTTQSQYKFKESPISDVRLQGGSIILGNAQNQHKCEDSSPSYDRLCEAASQSCSRVPGYGLYRCTEASPRDGKLQETSVQGVDMLAVTSPCNDKAPNDPPKSETQQPVQSPCQWEVSSSHVYKLQEAQVKPGAELPKQGQSKSMGISPGNGIIDARWLMPSPYTCQASRKMGASPDQCFNMQGPSPPRMSWTKPSQTLTPISVRVFGKQASNPNSNHQQCKKRIKLLTVRKVPILLSHRKASMAVENSQREAPSKILGFKQLLSPQCTAKQQVVAPLSDHQYTAKQQVVAPLSDHQYTAKQQVVAPLSEPQCSAKQQVVAPLSDSSLEDTNMNEHPWTVSPGLLVCPVCGKSFKEELSLMIHRKIHARNRPFVCMTCGRGFFSKDSVESHQQIHNGGKPFSCSYCGRHFTHKCNMTVHARTHTGEKPYACSICLKHFRQKQQVKIHEEMHTRTKMGNCENTFNQKSALDLSQQVHNGTPALPPYTITKTLPYTIPKEQQRPEQPKPFSCTACGASFNLKQHLATHQELHKGRKCHVCSRCEMQFIRKTDLNKHMRKHPKQQPFVCIPCNKSFRGISQLQKHLRSHPKLKG